MEKKSLILAWVLNVVPGVGIIYAGKTGVGVLFLILWVVALFLILTAILSIFGFFLWFLLSSVSCIIAAVLANKFNKRLA